MTSLAFLLCLFGATSIFTGTIVRTVCMCALYAFCSDSLLVPVQLLCRSCHPFDLAHCTLFIVMRVVCVILLLVNYAFGLGHAI
jgi:hypothetical protein